MDRVLESLERLKNAPSFMGGTVEYQYCTNSETPLMQDYEIVKQAVLELQSIKEATPSEALKELEELEKMLNKFVKYKVIDMAFINIKNALLKTQEQKQYLKWEDLNFTEEGKEIFALLNGTKYKLKCYKSGNEDTSIIISLNGVVVADLCSIFYKADKQFFNDLRLERVEE